MKENEKNIVNGPVVIGGVGGSGTRVVAKLLKTMGYYLGDSDEYTNDNIDFFTCLGIQIGLNKIIKLITRVLLED